MSNIGPCISSSLWDACCLHTPVFWLHIHTPFISWFNFSLPSFVYFSISRYRPPVSKKNPWFTPPPPLLISHCHTTLNIYLIYRPGQHQVRLKGDMKPLGPTQADLYFRWKGQQFPGHLHEMFRLTKRLRFLYMKAPLVKSFTASTDQFHEIHQTPISSRIFGLCETWWYSLHKLTEKLLAQFLATQMPKLVLGRKNSQHVCKYNLRTKPGE